MRYCFFCVSSLTLIDRYSKHFFFFSFIATSFVAFEENWIQKEERREEEDNIQIKYPDNLSLVSVVVVMVIFPLCSLANLTNWHCELLLLLIILLCCFHPKITFASFGFVNEAEIRYKWYMSVCYCYIYIRLHRIASLFHGNTTLSQ